MARPEPPEDFFRCPHCGTKVRCGAASCPECGSDHETGWSWDADPWSNEPPVGIENGVEDDAEDYERFLADEFPEHAAAQGMPGKGLAWYWKIAAVLLLLSFLLGYLL